MTTDALAALEPLVGDWEFVPSVGGHEVARGRTTFRWIEDGKFLHQLAEGDVPDDAPPDWQKNSPLPVTTITGVDDSTGRIVQLYADARGVVRIYDVSLVDGVWRVWRDAPGFFQRFVGTFVDDGRRIDGKYERSEDGLHWLHDFDVTYRKIS